MLPQPASWETFAATRPPSQITLGRLVMCSFPIARTRQMAWLVYKLSKLKNLPIVRLFSIMSKPRKELIEPQLHRGRPGRRTCLICKFLVRVSRASVMALMANVVLLCCSLDQVSAGTCWRHQNHKNSATVAILYIFLVCNSTEGSQQCLVQPGSNRADSTTREQGLPGRLSHWNKFKLSHVLY